MRGGCLQSAQQMHFQCAPSGTFWNALSGQQEKKRAMAFGGVRQLRAFAKAIVGAGSHTNMKSAMMAMITLAITKSSSCEKRPLRFSASAAHLVNMPMPHSMPIFTKKQGSAIKRSRKPARAQRKCRMCGCSKQH